MSCGSCKEKEGNQALCTIDCHVHSSEITGVVTGESGHRWPPSDERAWGLPGRSPVTGPGTPDNLSPILFHCHTAPNHDPARLAVGAGRGSPRSPLAGDVQVDDLALVVLHCERLPEFGEGLERGRHSGQRPVYSVTPPAACTVFPAFYRGCPAK